MAPTGVLAVVDEFFSRNTFASVYLACSIVLP